jgi:excisionase family DNA binding protein
VADLVRKKLPRLEDEAMLNSSIATRGDIRLALSLDEAAAALSVSRDFFDEHIRHELKVVRLGRKLLIPLRELERWLDEHAHRALDD